MSVDLLFIIPYAGGSSYSFNNWRNVFGDIEVCILDLPGKGKKSMEVPCRDFDEAIENLYEQINSKLDRCQEYFIFGHSMGGLLLYEILQKMVLTNNKRLPKCVFFSASVFPDNFDIKYILDFTDSQWKDKLDKMGGINKNIINSKLFLHDILKTIKRDYKLMSTYKRKYNDKSIPIKAFILSGNNDNEIAYDTSQWNNYFENPITDIRFDGGHFFIFERMDEVVLQLNKIMHKYIKSI